MKRIIGIILYCLILCFFSGPASGKDVTYDLKELGLSIAVPDDYIVFTRDTKKDDPHLKDYGFNKQTLLSYFIEKKYILMHVI